MTDHGFDPSLVPVRDAATVMLVRDTSDGLEVFMVVRHHEIDFASGALVFPGGKVDPEDGEAAWGELAPPADKAIDRSFVVAAARETFEEAGFVLARRRGSRDLLDAAEADRLDAAYRNRLRNDEATFLDLVRGEDLVLATDLMVPFAHGKWLAANVAGARARLLPDEGHISLVGRVDEVVDDLLERAGP